MEDPKWMLVVVAAAVLGLGGWAAASLLSPDDAVEDEGALPELPSPTPPRTRALLSAGGGFGWTWINPRPQGIPTSYAVDAAPGGSPVVMVGRDGSALRYEDRSLFVWGTGTNRTLRGVAWTGAREALAAGEGGVLVRLAEGGPTRLDSGVEVTLRDVAAVSATEALVVGDAGTVLRVADGVTRLEVPTDADLLAVHARGPIAFAVGTDGVVLRIEGRRVARERPGADVILRGVGGCPRGDLYAAGDQGVLLRRRRSGQWSRVRIGRREPFTSVSCDHGRVAAVTGDGRVVLVSGDRTVELPTGFDGPWHAVSGNLEGPSWLVGAGGKLATVERDHVRTRTEGPTGPIRDLGSMGGALVAVGEWGRIFRQTPRGLEQVESPTEAGLAALVQVAEGQLLAVGDYGSMVDIRYDRATLLTTPTDASLRAGVGQEGRLLIVGARGIVLRGTADALRVSQVSDAGDLWSVAGTPQDAVAVGEQGLVLRFDERGFRRVDCGTSTTLRAVLRTAEGTWAAGDEGRIVRITEQGCVEERSGGPTLHALGLGPRGLPLAAGDRGVALVRGEDGQWTPAGLDVAGASLRTVWRGARYTYLAGTRGTVVRHIVLN